MISPFLKIMYTTESKISKLFLFEEMTNQAPLHIACSKENVEIVKLLLDQNGIDVNAYVSFVLQI